MDQNPAQMEQQQEEVPAGLSRRGFIVGGGVGFGLVLGYAAWPKDVTNPLVALPGQVWLNEWVRIGVDGRTTVIVPQAEMGQGVLTSLPLILADELGANWQNVGAEPAMIDSRYANLLGLVEKSKALPSFLQGAGHWAFTTLARKMPFLGTGGSTSVRGFHDRLRFAGATARILLCKAAARKWEIDWLQCSTSNGYVIADNKQISFAEVAEQAAKEYVDPAEISLRPKRKHGLVGREKIPRIDIPAKVIGAAQFGLDVRIPNLHYAAIAFAPHGSQVASVDDSALAKEPGVVKTVRNPLWTAIVAKSWWQAQKALEKITIAYDNSKAVSSSTIFKLFDKAGRDALKKPDAKADIYVKKGNAMGRLKSETGLSRDYILPYLAHACMEPMNATVHFIAPDRLKVWAPTQSPTGVVMSLSKATDLPKEAITVVPTLLGGGFGRKGENDAVVCAALIAQEAKLPVQLIYSREEDLGHDSYRPAGWIRLRARLKANNRIDSLHARLLSQNVFHSVAKRNGFPQGFKKDNATVQGLDGLPYAIDHQLVEHQGIISDIPVGYWRSVGHSMNAFCIETFIDELADTVKADPLDFRLNMLRQAPRHAAVLSAAARHAGYGNVLDKGHAHGLALHESFGSIVAQVVEVSLTGSENPNLDGLIIHKVTAAIDCGRAIHPDTVRGQIEGSIIFALSAALYGRIDVENGVPRQRNFDSYPIVTMTNCPKINVHILNSGADLGGVGEPGVPPLAPALVNAIARAGGKRLHSLPIQGQILRKTKGA